MDPERVAREVDFRTLQQNINNVTFCDIESEIGPSVDPNYVKLFKLAQLTIEYLLNSQQYLTNCIADQESKLVKAQRESSNVSIELDKDKKELDRLKKECHKRKKLLAQQQQVLFAGGPGSYYKCPKCVKAFLNDSFLQSHLERKHPDYQPNGNSEQLNSDLEEVKGALEKAKQELENERKLSAELKRNAKAHEESEENLKQLLEESRMRDKETSQKQLEQFRVMFMAELKEINDKFRASQEALTMEQSKNKKRGIGNRIYDEEEMEQFEFMIEKQKHEIDLLRSQLDERSSLDDLKLQISHLKASHENQLERLKAELSDAKNASSRKSDDHRATKQQELVRKEAQDEIDALKKRNDDNEDQILRMQNALRDAKSFVENQEKEQQDVIRPKKIKRKAEPERTPNISTNSNLKSSYPPAKWDENAHNQKMQRMRESYLNDANFVAATRDECVQVLTTKLDDFGVQHNSNAMSEEEFSRFGASISVSHESTSRRNPCFFQMRDVLKTKLEDEFRRSVSRRLTPNPRPIEPVPQSQPEIGSRLQSGQPKPATPGEGSGPPEGRGHVTEETSDEDEEDEDDDGLPRGTIPFIAHALPEGHGVQDTDFRKKKKKKEKKNNKNLNHNNNNSCNDEVEFKEISIRAPEDNSLPRPNLAQNSSESEEEKGEDLDQEANMKPFQPQAATPAAASQIPKGGIRLPSTTSTGNEWDSLSEIDEENETNKRNDSSSSPVKYGSPEMGSNVRTLRDTIEKQLNNRGIAKKPAGGIDVGGKQTSKGVPVPAPRSVSSSKTAKGGNNWDEDEDEDDEDSFTVSSLEGLGQSHGRASNLRMPRSSVGASSTLTSSGDGGASTSQWGSSGGGGRSHGGRDEDGTPVAHAQDRRSIVDVVDWDSD